MSGDDGPATAHPSTTDGGLPVEAPPEWETTSSDPRDETFGDVVTRADVAALDAHEAVLVGEPFDGAVIGRRGAATGPIGIRESLAGVKTHHFDAGPVGSVGDLGDVQFAADGNGPDYSGADVRAAQATAREVAAAVHDADTLPVFVGGDNSLTYPNVAPLLESGSVAVLNCDAHLDCRAIPDDGPTSGTPYRQLLDAGLDRYVAVGARHFETSTAYHDYLRDRGGEVITPEEVADDLVGVTDRAFAAVGDVDHLYLSVDCDVLTAAAAPGVSAPTPGGITTRELFRLVRLFAADDRLAGLEVVECAPPLDRDGRTADAAARTVAHGLSAALSSGGGRP
jgi:formiminoglutamase